MYQVPKLEIVKGLNVSLLCFLLMQLSPEAVYAPHIQNLICIDLPRIAEIQLDTDLKMSMLIHKKDTSHLTI